MQCTRQRLVGAGQAGIYREFSNWFYMIWCEKKKKKKKHLMRGRSGAPKTPCWWRASLQPWWTERHVRILNLEVNGKPLYNGKSRWDPLLSGKKTTLRLLMALKLDSWSLKKLKIKTNKKKKRAGGVFPRFNLAVWVRLWDFMNEQAFSKKKNKKNPNRQ